MNLEYDSNGFLIKKSFLDTFDDSLFGETTLEYDSAGNLARYYDADDWGTFEVNIIFSAEGAPVKIEYYDDEILYDTTDVEYENGICRNITQLYGADYGSVTPVNQPSDYIKPGLGFSLSDSWAPTCLNQSK